MTLRPPRANCPDTLLPYTTPFRSGLNPPAKPAIIENFFLQGASRGVAVIKTPAGMTEVKEGTSIPRVGAVRSIRRADGVWVVVTSAGVIIQYRTAPPPAGVRGRFSLLRQTGCDSWRERVL